MPVVSTFYHINGQVVLDLTCKLMRRKYFIRQKYAASNPWTRYSAITGGNITFNVHDAYGVGAPTTVDSAGTRPADSLDLHTCELDGAICVMSGGSVSYGTNNINAVVKKIAVTESWSDATTALPKDMYRVYTPAGELLWSAGTLGDAVIFAGRLTFTALNQVKTISSTSGRRLHINIASVFMSGTIVIDEGGSSFTDSGIQYRFSNNGRTVTITYYTSGDGDINQALAYAGSLFVDVFEVYDE